MTNARRFLLAILFLALAIIVCFKPAPDPQAAKIAKASDEGRKAIERMPSPRRVVGGRADARQSGVVLHR
jgi:hypothetical protein